MNLPIQYIVFTQAWHNLLTLFDKAAQLPENKSSFESLFGDFDNKQGVLDLINSCIIINAQAKSLGGPLSLKHLLEEKPQWLLENTPPDDLYSHIIWFSSQIQNVSSSIRETFGNIIALFRTEAGGSGEEKANNLKSILAGDKGLAAQASTINDNIAMLNDKISFIQPNFFNAVLTISKTVLLNEVNQSIGVLRNLSSQQQKKVDDAYLKWTHSILHKEKKKQEYESLKDELDRILAELKKKQGFTSILDNDFFIANNQVTTSIQDIKTNLKAIDKIFKDFGQSMRNICSVSNTQQLSDYKWVSSTLNLAESIQYWDNISKKSRDFIQQSISL